VQARDRPTLADQLVHEIDADESRTPGHERCFHIVSSRSAGKLPSRGGVPLEGNSDAAGPESL
jgi:hypothetical protein